MNTLNRAVAVAIKFRIKLNTNCYYYYFLGKLFCEIMRNVIKYQIEDTTKTLRH